MMQNIIKAAGVMFVHSLWQGMLIAGIATLLIRSFRGVSSLRYNLLCICFGLLVVVCGYTFVQQYLFFSNSSVTTISPVVVTDNVYIAEKQTSLIDVAMQWCISNSYIIVGCWLIIFLFKITSMTRSLLLLKKVTSIACSNVDDLWQQKLKTLAASMNISFQLLFRQSMLVTQPIVIGFLKPVILVPIGLLTQLPPVEAEAILLHELAHIKRNDFLVNLMQSFAECIFFFNPGLLILSSMITREREYCCDDLAIKKTGDKKTFIRALASFHELQPQLVKHAMAFGGRRGLLAQRVHRIIHQKKINAMSKILPLFTLIFIGFLFVSFSILPGKEINNKKSIEQQKMPALQQETKRNATILKIEVQEPDKKAITSSVIKHSLGKPVIQHDTIPAGASKDFIAGYNAALNFKNSFIDTALTAIEKKQIEGNARTNPGQTGMTSIKSREAFTTVFQKKEKEKDLINHTEKLSGTEALVADKKTIEEQLAREKKEN